MQCPSCSIEVPEEQIDIKRNRISCSACGKRSKISDVLEDQLPDAFILKDPPDRAWYDRGRDDIIIGASTRSKMAFFLIPFMLVWSGFSLG